MPIYPACSGEAMEFQTHMWFQISNVKNPVLRGTEIQKHSIITINMVNWFSRFSALIRHQFTQVIYIFIMVLQKKKVGIVLIFFKFGILTGKLYNYQLCQEK